MRLTYFAQQREGFIKIGHAYQVRRKLRELRRTMPSVHLLAVTGEPVHKVRRKFKDAHAFENWYHPSEGLSDFILPARASTEKLLRVQEKEGLSRFGEWLADKRISYAEAGRALKVTRSYVQMLATGDATPSMKIGLRIMAWVKEMDPATDLKHEDLFDD